MELQAMPLRNVSLDDKFVRTNEACLISGPQALVRMLLAQRRRDADAGLNTAGFVSGYRGSPLGLVDLALWDAKRWLDQNGIVFQPGINEDLAATAVWGSQQLAMLEDATVDGVFALWYGKGPGVDRSGDALKHGNCTGCHPNGGVLVVLGDDHSGKSSTLAHHSEQAMVHAQMPVLYPSSVAEFVRFGLLGWAMSRYAGCWAAFKVVNETIEQTATVAADDDLEIVTPPKGELPAEGLYYHGRFTPAGDEIVQKRWRLPLAQKFCRANRIDRAEFGSAGCRLGIVTAGKSYGDVLQALRYLGIDGARAHALQLDIYKVGMIWPLEPLGLREFSEGCAELFVVEEKSAFMEPQVTALFYNDARRPRVVGKCDERGSALLPSDLQIEPVQLALTIAARLQHNGLADGELTGRVATLRSVRHALLPMVDAAAKRLPFFCSGCPHSTSTEVPEGSLAMSGIGCHGMAIWAKPGTTLRGTHMGAEGVNWAALQHFASTSHVFQNMGDGTYYHSGLLAVRQAIAAKANITYKILFNDAVAMTGGQAVDGPLTPAIVARQMLAEGAVRVVLVTDDPGKHPPGSMPAAVAVRHRDALDEIQRELREVPGCTAIIYEQVCAAEKRRRRKRGQMEDPLRRMVINEAVCEGCGDCSVQSGCVSIEPVQTELGRKRRINQSSCNKDFRCADGFCPSFVTVEGVEMKKRWITRVDDALMAALPEPPAPVQGTAAPAEGANVMLAGIGGTGVITVGSVLAMAAHLQHWQASVYDMTGMSQKNGAVLSHLRIARGGMPIATPVLGLGEASLVLAFDMIAAVSDEAYRSIGRDTRFLGNERVQPTAAFTLNADERVDTSLLARAVQRRLGDGEADYVDASGIALALCGDTIASNFFMVGVALQRGWLPLDVKAVERALELNGVQVALNQHALHLGRLWAHDRAAIRRLVRGSAGVEPDSPVTTLDELLADRARRLTAYQGPRYAQRYLASIDRIRAAESAVRPGASDLASTAARTLFKLMAYKDEYEVARLHADPAFRQSIGAQFEGRPRLRFHLAPPLLARRDPRTGRLRKREFGAWILPVFRVLRHMKFVRGTLFDPFGHTAERRAERALIVEFERLLLRIASGLRSDNLDQAVLLAAVAATIRGFGHVKEDTLAQARLEQARLLEVFESVPAPMRQRLPAEARAA